MKSYEATALNEANPEAIWAILTDAPGLSRWDLGIDRVDGRIAPGETIKVFSQVSPGRAFPVEVKDFTPGRGMRWSGGMPLGPSFKQFASGLKREAEARSRVS